MPSITTTATTSLLPFVHTSKAQEAGHTLHITSEGIVYSHCHNSKVCDNELGQLGRPGNPNVMLPIILSSSIGDVRAARAYTGGFPSSGHSAILDTHGNIWLTGCDRWQQLGLGSSSGGSTGYTWKDGRLWQDVFQRNEYLIDLLKRLDPSLDNATTTGSDMSKRWVRDVALGGDHTIILSSNRRDVISFGKGGEGQLGLSSKPWVSSPAKSKQLSSSKFGVDIAAVCAFRNCSMTLNDSGGIEKKAGKCSMDAVKGLKRALDLCLKRAREDGLIDMSAKS